ncbi:MAG: isochorismatase family protein [Bacteroidales bacterium]|jgi:nicotinamidase-related amidase|nr:isochorismatase family protein [Bacteroidales bacterium]
MKKTLTVFICLLLTASLFAQDQEKKELKPALIVMDVQHVYLDMMDPADKEQSFDYINAAIWLFEKYDLPIIRVYHQDKQRGPDENSEAFKFAKEINIKDDYPMIIKHYGNAFNQTNLDQILKEKGINTIFLCGLSATGCVLSTYVGAEDCEYDVFMIEKALLSPNAQHTDFIAEIKRSIDFQTLNFLLGYTQ